MTTASTTRPPYFPPYNPQDFRDVLPDLNQGNVCENLEKAAEFDQRWAATYAWIMNEARQPTDEFSQWVCSIGCGNFTTEGTGTTDTTTTSTSTTTGAPLAPVDDLLASQGHDTQDIALRFSAVTGADSYDIYMGLTNDGSLATLVDSDRFPYDATLTLQGCDASGSDPRYSCSLNPFENNGGGELVYTYTLPIKDATVRYFFVVAKNSTNGAISPKSTGAAGWSQGFGVEAFAQRDTLYSGSSSTSTAGYTRARIVFFGAGGGGAGGGFIFGGGGGGGGALIYGEFTIDTPGTSTYRMVATPNADTGNAANQTDGADGALVEFQYSAIGDGSDWVTLAASSAAVGGKYSSGGSGAGGAGSTGTVDGSLTNVSIFNGTAGNPAVGTHGGGSGQHAFGRRFPGAHYAGFAAGSYNGNNGTCYGASGCYANPTAVILALGGSAERLGKVIIWLLP